MVCVVLREGARMDEAALLAFRKGQLGRYNAPKVLRLVNDLPRGRRAKCSG